MGWALEAVKFQRRSCERYVTRELRRVLDGIEVTAVLTENRVDLTVLRSNRERCAIPLLAPDKTYVLRVAATFCGRADARCYCRCNNVITQDDVDDTRDRIRTVNGRGGTWLLPA